MTAKHLSRLEQRYAEALVAAGSARSAAADTRIGCGQLSPHQFDLLVALNTAREELDAARLAAMTHRRPAGAHPAPHPIALNR